MAEDQKKPSRNVYRFAVATCCSTIFLLMAGALVTSNNAGDSVPDWPLAYDRLIPPLFGGVIFEYSHRVLAGIVSVMVLVLAVWLARTERREAPRRLGWAAVGLIIAQSILGGIRVLKGYPALTATAHAVLAQIFFILVVALAVYLSPWWQSELPQLEDSGSPRVRSLALWTTAAVLVQLVLGAAFRHGALGITPHLVGAGVVTVLVMWTGVALKERFGTVRDLRRAVTLLHSTFGIQVLLGGAAWWAMSKTAGGLQPTMAYVVLSVAHVLGGALMLAACVVLSLACFRMTHPRAASATEGTAETARA